MRKDIFTWLLRYAVTFAMNIGFWIWQPFGNTPLAFTIVYLPVFLFSFIILIVIDWTWFRKKMGVRIIVLLQLSLFFILFSYLSTTGSIFFIEVPNNAKWFVIVYSDKVYNDKVYYSFPLSKVLEVKSEKLNFINRKQQCSFMYEKERDSEGNIICYSYRFQFNDTIDLKHERYLSDSYDFVIYKVYPYELTQSDLDTIKAKINEFLSKTSGYEVVK